MVPFLHKHAEISMDGIITYYSQFGCKHQSYSRWQTNEIVGNQVGQGDDGLHPGADENPRACALKTRRHGRSVSKTIVQLKQDSLPSRTYQHRVEELHERVDYKVVWDELHDVSADSEWISSFQGFPKDPGVNECCWDSLVSGEYVS